MSIIWDEVEEIAARARELGVRPIFAATEEAERILTATEIEKETAALFKRLR